jgi:molybdopterin molybdotransferase/putative molybdopterin biosynthesis protein
VVGCSESRLAKELILAHKRNVYLQMKSLEEARDIVLAQLGGLGDGGVEQVPAPDALGRVLAEPVVARFSSPNFHAAAMDGIAVAAADTFGAHEARPRQLRVGREAFFVNTGHVMPPDTDAVIMIEHVQILDDERVQIEAPAFPWQHVRKMGEDIVATEMLFARRHVITPYCVGALLSAGVFEVSVRRRPRVLILPTGSELVDWRSLPPRGPQPGQVIESNGYMLSNLVTVAGGSAVHHEMIGDDIATIEQAVREAVDQGFEMILISGGSSSGSEDFARTAIASLGDVLVHGVTMMPGKPVIVGRVGGRAVFGIPGYPVSAIMAFEQLVQPLLACWQGLPEPRRPRDTVVLTRKAASKLGVEEFLRVKIGQVGDRLVATPLPRGAGCITSITEADGIVRIPAHVEGVHENTPVTAELLRPRQAIGNTLVIVGSHDNTLDVLADELRAQGTNLSLSSSHVGSMGGLMALKRGVCHMAGSHLLDERDGSYNRSYIQKYLAGIPVKQVHLVMRDQGLMVLPGNPKGIAGLEDLARDDVRLVNRQGGSGTRILLDFRLRQLDIPADRVQGYGTEEFTHMAVAVAVLSGSADVGLGIHAAATALGLDFIPVVTEQYDLVLRGEYFEGPAVQTLLQVIGSPAFKSRVRALGGYHTERTGEILM